MSCVLQGESHDSPWLVRQYDGAVEAAREGDMAAADRQRTPPADRPPQWLLAIVTIIDTVIGEWSGKIFCWLVIPLVFGLAYEVVVRYVFNTPTVWAYDVTYILYGSHFMLGAAYALYKGLHIRTDMFYANYSIRWKGIVDASLYLLFFFPGMILFMLAGWEEAMHAWSIGEKSDASPWRPIIYPFKTVVPVTAVMMLLQGVSEVLKSGYAAIKGRSLQR
jgi:TRAP-type mannitol/chloroaromatic compound transport system permease small subunit